MVTWYGLDAPTTMEAAAAVLAKSNPTGLRALVVSKEVAHHFPLDRVAERWPGIELILDPTVSPYLLQVVYDDA